MSIPQLEAVRQNLIAELAPLRDSDFETLHHKTKWVDVSLVDGKLYLRPRPYERSISFYRWSDLIPIITNFVSKCLESLRRFFLHPYARLERKVEHLIHQTNEYLREEKNPALRAEFLNLYTPVYFKLLSAIKKITNEKVHYPQMQKDTPFYQWIGAPDSRLGFKQCFFNGECPENVQVAEFGLFRDFNGKAYPQSIGFKVSKWLSPNFEQSLTRFPYLLKLRLEGQKEEETMTKELELGCTVADYTASIDDQLQPTLEIVPYRVVEDNFARIRILPKIFQVTLSKQGSPCLSQKEGSCFLKVTNTSNIRMYYHIAMHFSGGRKESTEIQIQPLTTYEYSIEQLTSLYSPQFQQETSLSLADNSFLFMNITRFTLSTD